MSGAAAPRPTVLPSPEGARHWAAAAERRLEIPHCDDCDTAFFYPRPLCPACGSRNVGWMVSSGRGTLHSFCVQYRSGVPGLAEAAPFVTALVDLDEGPRLMSLLVDVPADPEWLRCDTPVEVAYLELTDRISLPVFRPAAPADAQL
jgi:uncharacterized protein